MDKKMYETPEMEEVMVDLESPLMIGGDSNNCTADDGDDECD